MKISVEISMYPLDKNYESPIIDFIERLNRHATLQIKTNTMSTQIFGEYDTVMSALSQEIKESFGAERKVSMVIKILNADLGGEYIP